MEKLENNWRTKTLEALEKDVWGEPEYNSHLVSTCHQLRKRPLNEFDNENLRILIGQNIGLKYLIPIAIEVLNENILAEGDLYAGDLLKSVLTSDENYWRDNKVEWLKVCDAFNQGIKNLESEAEVYPSAKKLFEQFDLFKKMHNMV